MKSIRWLFVLIILVLVLAGIQAYNQSKKIKQSQVSTEIQNQPVASAPVTVSAADPVRGAAGAASTLVVFSDFECPYCAEVAPVLKQLVEQSQGKVRLVWKDFPLPSHPNASGAAVAARCAANQGKFWEYHDALFQNQAELGSALYTKLAKDLQIDESRFSQCLTSGQTNSLVQRGVQEGTGAKIDGTPYLFINGRTYTGGLSYAELSQAIGVQ